MRNISDGVWVVVANEADHRRFKTYGRSSVPGPVRQEIGVYAGPGRYLLLQYNTVNRTNELLTEERAVVEIQRQLKTLLSLLPEYL